MPPHGTSLEGAQIHFAVIYERILREGTYVWGAKYTKYNKMKTI